ncbi:DUF1129 domain-containing protein [Litchfieldia alkalitelluris]|uniref:hypothetical protein n=1 Tax=Litchfieldia alkalitelluris TaxID=304268 RepID=UPI0009968683|nr:hypothetical protein [Litchfieldia alkalitelluris]
MDFTINLSNSLPSMIITVVTWAIVVVWFIYLYKKSEKPPVWKAILILILGIFSFSFNFDALRIPILPLGVWIAYWILKRDGQMELWQRYRKFAWLGFWANFIFLIGALITSPLHSVLYPKDEISTYISKFDEAEIVVTHPSANEIELINDVGSLLDGFKKQQVDSIQWFEEVHFAEEDEQKERFPYQMVKTKPKGGSQLQTVIFVERDGKGLLITTPTEQFYYRSENSLIKEGDQ